MVTMTAPPLDLDGYTIADLQALPEDGLHIELDDGCLVVSPPEVVRNGSAAFRLGMLLHAAVGPDWLVVKGPGVAFTSRDYRDRLVKPEQYAAAGIPHFWRLEPADRVLLTYALDGAAYRETGRFTDAVAVEEPVRLRFELSQLLD